MPRPAKNPIVDRIGDIDCLVANPEQTGQTVVLFHGFGASFQDLFPLCSFADGFQNYRWIFPNGTEILRMHGVEMGRAWFPLSVQAFEQGLTPETLPMIAKELAAHLDRILGPMMSFIKALESPAEKLVLGGFSQGAMLATHLALSMSEQVKGLAIFSGTLAHMDAWTQNAPKHKGLPFIQSHGYDDPILPYFAAQRLNVLLTSAGLTGEFMPFHGGHTIPEEALNTFVKFLAK